MGNYTVIADVGQAIAALLKKSLVPEVVQKAEQIGLCHPKEPGEYNVGIYLYDIQESNGIRNTPKRRMGEEQLAFPSTYLDLYYMLVPFSRSDAKYRPTEEQKLLGKMIQVLRDYPSLNKDTYESELKLGPQTMQIELLDISFEDKVRIWSSFNEAGHTSLYCKVSPVELKSNRSQNIKRVREIEMQFGERGNVHG